MGERLGDGIVHQLQAGIAAHEHLLRLAAQDIGEQLPRRGNTRHLAIVAGLHPVGYKLLRLGQHLQHGRHHVQLLAAGLAPRHVQFQMKGLRPLEFRLDSRVFRLPLRLCHLFIILLHHERPPASCFLRLYTV